MQGVLQGVLQYLRLEVHPRLIAGMRGRSARVTSCERGDPRDHSFIHSFGGGGGLYRYRE